jgi:hypothetical protein
VCRMTCPEGQQSDRSGAQPRRKADEEPSPLASAASSEVTRAWRRARFLASLLCLYHSFYYSGATQAVRLTLRFTGHKRNTNYGRSAFNDKVVIAKAARLLWSFVQAVVKCFLLFYFFLHSSTQNQGTLPNLLKKEGL